jgi:hypothetical protein
MVHSGPQALLPDCARVWTWLMHKTHLLCLDYAAMLTEFLTLPVDILLPTCCADSINYLKSDRYTPFSDCDTDSMILDFDTDIMMFGLWRRQYDIWTMTQTVWYSDYDADSMIFILWQRQYCVRKDGWCCWCRLCKYCKLIYWVC